MDPEVDATRRTRLASERTYLAWWRGGLTALAVAVGAGAIVPDLTTSARWPFALLGTGFALLGLGFIVYGLRRHRAIEAALRRGDFAPLGGRATLTLTASGAALAIMTVVLVLVEA